MDSTKAGPDGSFTLKNVAPGDYTLTVRVPANGDAPAEAASIALTIGTTDVEGVVLTTSGGGSMTGRLVFDGGVAAPQAAAQFRIVPRPVKRDAPAASAGAPNPDSGRVRPDWSFSLTSVMGANRIGVTGLPQGWAVKSVDAQGDDFTDSPADFSAGEKYEDVVVTLTNRSPTLTGTTTDRRAAAVEAMVIVFADDANKWAEDSRMVRTGALRQGRHVQDCRAAARRLSGDRDRVRARR
jgi:hypothetical protein